MSLAQAFVIPHAAVCATLARPRGSQNTRATTLSFAGAVVPSPRVPCDTPLQRQAHWDGVRIIALHRDRAVRIPCASAHIYRALLQKIPIIESILRIPCASAHRRLIRLVRVKVYILAIIVIVIVIFHRKDDDDDDDYCPRRLSRPT